MSFEKSDSKIVFTGKLDDDVKSGNVRVVRRGRVVKYFIFAFLLVAVSVLVYNFFKEEGQGFIGFLTEDGGAFSFVPLALGVICLFLAVKEIVLPKAEKTDFDREYKVVFDGADDTFSYCKSGGESKTFPLSCITKYTDEGKYFTVFYEVRTEEIKAGKVKGAKKSVDKLFSVSCQKNLITEGSESEFKKLLDKIVAERIAQRKERLNKVKSYGIAAIVLSLIAVALTYPLFKLGGVILNEYAGKIFDNFFGRYSGAEKIVAGLFLGLFVCVYWLAVVLVGLVCYVLPVPLFLVALILLIIQLVFNRKAISFIALSVFVLSFAGYCAFLFSGAVVY